jgi:hypothetical protein
MRSLVEISRLYLNAVHVNSLLINNSNAQTTPRSMSTAISGMRFLKKTPRAGRNASAVSK